MIQCKEIDEYLRSKGWERETHTYDTSTLHSIRKKDSGGAIDITLIVQRLAPDMAHEQGITVNEALLILINEEIEEYEDKVKEYED